MADTNTPADGGKKPIRKLADITPDTPPEDWPEWYHPPRPPFEPGNEVALVHGAKSPRKVAPLALDILNEARGRPEWPKYLNDPSYTEEIWAWAWSEAVCEKLRLFLSSMDVDDMLAETGEEVETVKQVSETKQRRRTTSRRQKSALDLLTRWESIASSHRDKLGLNPLARSRISRDTAAASVDLATLWAKMAEGEIIDEGVVEPPAIEPHIPERYQSYYRTGLEGKKPEDEPDGGVTAE